MNELALTAMGLGLLSASALLVGAGAGLMAEWPERLVAAVMAFGAGALISALAFDLVAEGHEKAGFGPVAGGFLIGTVAFVVANQAINARGGFLRKPATLYRFLREQRRRRAIALLARLSRVEALRALPPEDVQGLVPFVEGHHYRAGQTIFRAGDPGDALYLVESGTVDIHAAVKDRRVALETSSWKGDAPQSLAATSADTPLATASRAPSVASGDLWPHASGQRAPVGETAAEMMVTLGPGEAFGEMALLAGHPHHRTAVARTDVHLWRIRKDRLEMLTERSPAFAAAVEALRARHAAGLSRGAAASTSDNPPEAGSKIENSPWRTRLGEVADQERWHAAAVRHLNRSHAATVTLTSAEHEAHAQEHARGGAPTAIFMGALLDGIPESVVIGASLIAEAAFSPVFVVAVFISNLPEALSSAAGMRQRGYSRARVLGLWGSLVLFSGVAALLGNVLLTGAPEWVIAGTQAVAAGGILAMLADTMMPEAFEQGGPYVALWTALGFLLAFFVKTVGGA